MMLQVPCKLCGCVLCLSVFLMGLPFMVNKKKYPELKIVIGVSKVFVVVKVTYPVCESLWFLCQDSFM